MTKVLDDLSRDDLLRHVQDMGGVRSSDNAQRRLTDYEMPEIPLGLRIMKPVLVALVLIILGGIGLTILLAAFSA